jgi:hypothetical protein
MLIAGGGVAVGVVVGRVELGSPVGRPVEGCTVEG